jgi:phage tail-like protein
VDPYKNFKFRLKWDGKYVVGVSVAAGLERKTEVVEHREGGDPSASLKSPGRTQFEPIVLERGLTHDTVFEDWANQVWKSGAALGSESMLNEFRKDIYLELYNEAGQLVRAYKIYRCWPSEYQAVSKFDANCTSVMIERITLQNEGWDRDASVTEPVQP